MATEILVNDGGAPARILPIVAGEAITAGDALSVDTSGEVVKADTDLATGHVEYCVGFALTDTTSGSICDVISGKGVILNINCADVTAGKGLRVSNTAGRLEAVTGTLLDVIGHPCAVSLEDTGAAGLHKCVIISG